MDYKNLLISLGFRLKENVVGVFFKKYRQVDDYCLEVDFEKQTINYGEKIQSDSKTTQNFSQPENLVVLECVNRLLEKGYKPENIILEKTWGAGHGTSGRLDICVTRDDSSEYLLIECKTYGKEFDKEFARMKKDGGQLFTYFKFSNKADVIMLYASELKGKEIIYRNEIVKIEDDYRTGDVKDFYEKWNKLFKDNGVFDNWVKPYNFQSKALTKEQLKDIRNEDSSFIFNRFLEILRHNVVSDEGNAFNKIFTLFLCKVYDETSTLDGEELQFQWKEGIDNHIDFQLRLTDLYSKGMQKFLDRTVSDFNEEDFNKRCKNLNDETKDFLLREINKLRLEKNNEFAIKEVYDTKSFEENAKVVKEVVELLQSYRIRYNKRQQYLSDFFEQLLTTGLKQKAGQFFTPVPISQFIIKSLPLDTMVADKLKQKDGEILPYMIDYAAGSGHFITEYMHEVQKFINQSEPKNYIDLTKRKIENWQGNHFDWATQYVYGVEKDYRLVKVGKVGCYLHGDGLANVILSDGLANFSKCKDYKLKLKKDTNDSSKDNQQFDVLLSNPPYSVAAFRQTTRDYYTENDFELYSGLTDNSSEIECLFVERTKQLLKDGGVAGVILPSSILSNEGIYTKAREIILQNFEIVAIAELGSNTFMATGTNTVVLFLRRRNNYDSINLRESVERFFVNFQDISLNGIENPFSKYVKYVWEGLSWEDYLSLLKNDPYDFIETECELYREYRKKLKVKTEKEFWQKFIEIEKEKLLYFILAYPQKVVLVKTGEKDAEKHFLGYEFSNRRGSEGIHPIQRGKTIAECTKLFDEEQFDNEEKASTYIYKAFSGDYDFPIHETLKDNISRVRLVDMFTFDRAGFAKNISTSIKKKVTFDSKWDLVKLGDYLFENEKSNIKVGTAKDLNEGEYPFFTSGESIFEFNEYLVDGQNIYLSTGGNAVVKFYEGKAAYSTDTFVVKSNNEEKIKTEFIFHLLESVISDINDCYFKGVGLKHLQKPDFRNTQIPLPPKEIQEKIVSEIKVLEKKEAGVKEKIEELKIKTSQILDEYLNQNKNIKKLGDVVGFKRGPFGGSLKKEIFVESGYKIYEQQHAIKNDFSIGRYYITEEKFNEMKGFELIEDDLIMSCSGTIGRIAVFPKNAEKGIINQALLRFRPIENLTIASYLRICLSHITSKFEDNSHGTGLKNVASVEILKDIDVYCPSLPEQQEIVAEIETIETQIAEFEQQLSEIPKQKEEVLKKYL